MLWTSVLKRNLATVWQRHGIMASGISEAFNSEPRSDASCGVNLSCLGCRVTESGCKRRRVHTHHSNFETARHNVKMPASITEETRSFFLQPILCFEFGHIRPWGIFMKPGLETGTPLFTCSCPYGQRGIPKGHLARSKGNESESTGIQLELHFAGFGSGSKKSGLTGCLRDPWPSAAFPARQVQSRTPSPA